LRILYIVHAFPPEQVGGTQLNVYWVAKQVSEVHDLLILTRSYDPTLPNYHETDEEFDGLKVHRINLRDDNRFFYERYADERMATTCDRVLKRFRPDLVHVNHIIGLSTETIRRIRAAGSIPIVLTLRDFFFICHMIYLFDVNHHVCSGPEGGAKCAPCIRVDASREEYLFLSGLRNERMRDRLLQKLGEERLEYMLDLLRIPDAILCPSEYVRSKFVEAGFPGNRIQVSPTGVQKSLLMQVPEPVATGRVRFGFTGSISPHKGVDTLVEAFIRMPERRAELRIFGFGYEGYLESLKAKASGSDVRFKGSYKPEDLARVFSEIDVLVLPSICHESYSLAIREAMAARRPVVVSDLSAQADAVRDGVDGFHFRAGDSADLAEKMMRFVHEPSLVRRMSRNCPAIRDIADQAADLVKKYESLVKGGASVTVPADRPQ
jgi:glycosyltransferase involved in cell wall biosynthesis